jgi:hypothetical protein
MLFSRSRSRLLALVSSFDFLLLIFAAGTVEETYYFIAWTTFVIFLLFGLIFDVLFSAETSFVFDPNYDNWRRRVDSKY